MYHVDLGMLINAEYVPEKNKTAIKRTFIEKLKLTIISVKHEVTSKP